MPIIEVTLVRWSRFNASFLADFPLGTEEIGYEEEAFFDRANCGCPEAAEMGLAVSDLIRQLGISEQTFYRWKKQYGGLQSEQARELKQLVEENGRLKKLVAELSLDKAVRQDVLSKKFPGQRL